MSSLKSRLVLVSAFLTLGCQHVGAARVKGGRSDAFGSIAGAGECAIVASAGTLWKGDVDVAFLQHLARRGLLAATNLNGIPPEKMPAVDALVRKADSQTQKSTSDLVDLSDSLGVPQDTELALRSMYAKNVAGIDADAFRAEAASFGRRYAAENANPAMRELLSDPGMHCDVWVADIGSEPLLRAAAGELGVDPGHVHGADVRTENGVLTDTLTHPSPLRYQPYLKSLKGLSGRRVYIRAVASIDDLGVAKELFPGEQKLLVRTPQTDKRLSDLADRLDWFVLE